MKKRNILAVIMSVIMMLCLTGCYEEEEAQHVLNAEIVDINTENKVFTVKDPGEQDIFGDSCSIDCWEADRNYRIFYCDYETSEITDITFSDLQIGDEVILYLYASELAKAMEEGAAKAVQVQLSTQRLD